MESDQKTAARDKLVSKACTWLDCRNARIASTGADKDAAQTNHRKAEHELAEAVEKYRKAEN